VYFQNGNYEEAAKDFDNVLGREPNDIFSNLHRGMSFYQMGEFDKALKDFEQVLKLDPNNSEAKEWIQKLKETKK
jgi:tetratricopeptide (TPR) repeat protein